MQTVSTPRWVQPSEDTVLSNLEFYALVRKAIEVGFDESIATVIAVEFNRPQLIPPGNEPFYGKLLDLQMLVLFTGGCERTEAEYRALFEKSGFRLARIVPTQITSSILEGVRA